MLQPSASCNYCCQMFAS